MRLYIKTKHGLPPHGRAPVGGSKLEILTVKGDVSAEEVAAVVAEAGFQAQEVVSPV